MPIATAHTVSLEGASGHVIDVQADVGSGLAGTVLVGRPDTAINESRERCRSAVQNCELDWPATKHVTILLSPADLPKRGPHFDLAVAVAVLAAHRTLPVEALEGVVLIGELTLEGRLRSVPGVLPMVIAASRHGIRRAIVPEPHVEEATMVPGVEVIGARSLLQVLAVLSGTEIPEAPPVEPLATVPLLTWRGAERLEDVDLADVRGMADTRYALEVAAAGAHHLLLSGPRGAGKTTLAERLPGLLPDLDLDESLELTAIHSLAGTLPTGASVMTRPPFSAPHHSASRTSLIGGGSGRVRPGELSRAHLGVVFLDEFPLFRSDIVEALREPLESGEITIARGEEVAVFPARSMVVLAANPCPCGDFHPSAASNYCRCGETLRRNYRLKLTGPVIDRVDITRHVEPITRDQHDDPLASEESTADVRERVVQARARQAARYVGTRWRLNSDVPGAALRESWPLEPAAKARLDEQMYAGKLTHRGAVRVHRLAWTVADLRGRPRPGPAELDVALRLRTGRPLESAVLDRSRFAAPIGSAIEVDAPEPVDEPVDDVRQVSVQGLTGALADLEAGRS